MDLFSAKFSTGEVVAASGMSNANVQSHIKRGNIAGQISLPEGGGSPGRRRAWTFGQLMQVAVANALLSVMSNADHAFRAAKHFAFTGSDARLPGLPCHHDKGQTYLMVSGEQSRICVSEKGCVSIRSFQGGEGTADPVVILDLTALFQAVLCRLSTDHPFKVLDNAYSDIRSAGSDLNEPVSGARRQTIPR